MRFIKLGCLFSILFTFSIAPALSANNVPVYSADNEGVFFKDWLLCGPFPNSHEKNIIDYRHGSRCTFFIADLMKDIGGEAKAEPQAGDKITLADPPISRSWFLHRSKEDLVNFNDIFTPNDNVVSYAFCYVDSPDERKVMAAIGSNDNVKFWLNGELVHHFVLADGRWLAKDDDYVPITLKKGRNRLLFKVCEGTGAYGLVFRLLDYDQTVKSILDNVNSHNKLSAVTKIDELKITFGTPHRFEAITPEAKVHYEINHKEKGLIASFDGREGFELSYPLENIPDGFLTLKASIPIPGGQVANQVNHFKGKLPRFGYPERLKADLAMRDADGKPFFPIGTYGAAPEYYSIIKEAGYNFIMGGEASLDGAHKAGLKVGVSMHGSGEHWLDHIREIVRKNREHPALLFWMLFDEPGYNKADLLQMHEAYKLIRQEDPVNPVYLVITDPRVYETFGRCCDLLSVDTYPISQGDIASVGDNIARAYAVSDGDTPVWHCGQLFQWPGDCYPTIQEHRFMSYLAIQSGAKAMLWYSFRYQGGPLPEAVPELWQSHVQLIKELHELEPILLYPGLGERLLSGNNDIRVTSKRGPDGSLTIFAVNTSKTETIVSNIQCPTQDSKNIPALFEDRSVSMKEGVIQDTFEPLGVHIYQIK